MTLAAEGKICLDGLGALHERDVKLPLMTAAKASRGRGKLIAHVGANRTEDSVELAKYAADVGVDWVSSVAPQLYRNTFAATMFHCRRIAQATDLPFMVY